MNQDNIWRNHTRRCTIDDVIKEYRHPAQFQIDLSHYINALCASHTFRKVCEAGCEFGVTSLLLSKNLEKTYLDLNPHAIELCRNACDSLGQTGNFIVADMFAMPFPDSYFDIVFNAGVIEHFKFRERVNALHEYKRVLSDNGIMLIAFPNHYSIPYRTAYLVRKRLLLGYKYPFPREYKIFDLSKELKETGLLLIERKILSYSSIFQWWNFFPPIMRYFEKDILNENNKKYEGYLTVLTIRKEPAG